MSERRVVQGYLGWSNVRGGCEFYQDVEGARWTKPREAYLTDLLGDPEGANVIVIVSRDRFDKLDGLADAVEQLVRIVETDEPADNESGRDGGSL